MKARYVTLPVSLTIDGIQVGVDTFRFGFYCS